MTDIENKRTTTDILISMEETLKLLVKTITAGDMNNKLILDRLNKIVSLSIGTYNSQADNTQLKSVKSVSSAEISATPITTRTNRAAMAPVEQVSFPSSDEAKIAIGQRVTNISGKDVYMAEVFITNKLSGEVTKAKTNAIGKWQSHLAVGKYNVNISKITDLEKNSKIESNQEIEVSPKTKSIQLPVITLKL